MGTKRLINRYQMLCMGFLSILAPIVRTMPRQQVIEAWDSAWLTPLIAAIPLLLLMLLTESCFRHAAPSDGFSELFIKGLGKTGGKIICLLFAGWLVYYTAFSLRLSADRYVFTAYKMTSPMYFTIVLLALSAIPLFDSLRSLARAALVFFPILFVALLIIFIFALTDIKKECIAPIAIADWPAVFRSIPPVVSIISLSIYFGFLEGHFENKEGRLLWAVFWLLLAVIVIFLIIYLAIGFFSAQEVTRVKYAFFSMVQNLPHLNSVVRVEPILIALWVSSDFLFISSLMYIIYTIVRRCFGYKSDEAKCTKITNFKEGRFLIWLIMLAIFVLTFFIPKEVEQVSFLSGVVVPYINLAFTFGLLPFSLLIGKIRKKY